MGANREFVRDGWAVASLTMGGIFFQTVSITRNAAIKKYCDYFGLEISDYRFEVKQGKVKTAHVYFKIPNCGRKAEEE